MDRIRAALDERRGARLLKVSAAKVSGVRRTTRPGLICVFDPVGRVWENSQDQGRTKDAAAARVA